MPIKPENKLRYPKNWKEISQKIRQRAGNKCEFCGVLNHSYVNRYTRKYCFDYEDDAVYIVLTVAHLDHHPENCADDNLKALCQKCHLTYDAKHYATNARATRDKKAGVRYLFEPMTETT